MATATATETTPRSHRVGGSTGNDQRVVLNGVGWAGYEGVLAFRGNRARPRLLYLDGDLLLMSPGHMHERDKDRFHMFLVEAARALRMPFVAAGSTTYRDQPKQAGIEPDLSFYFASAARVRNKREIDLTVDPPPDLAIEVVYSHSAAEAIEVSRRLGIPELWVCDERGLTFRVLDPAGNYVASASSRAFPHLTAEEIVTWVRRPGREGDTDLEWLDDLASWLRETLLPRIAGAKP